MQFRRLVKQLHEATASVSDPEQALRKYGHVVGKVTWTWILWGWSETHASLPLPPRPQLQRWVICRSECLSYGANMPLAQVSGKLKEGVGGAAGPAAAPHRVCCHLGDSGWGATAPVLCADLMKKQCACCFTTRFQISCKMPLWPTQLGNMQGGKFW